MKKTFRIILLLCCTLLVLSAAGCDENSSASEGTPLMQLKMPTDGEEIAVMTTNYGVIKFRLFPEQAPKAVENFVTHARNGYYDGLTFHRVIDNFMIQSGDPTGAGTGGESIWGSAFEDEFSPNLVNFRGALSMANAGRNTNGSQFFIVQADASNLSSSFFDQYDSTYGYKFSNMAQVIKDKYLEIGGTPYLDGYYTTDLNPLTGKAGSGHTVFGQVFEGMDVVDAIAAVDTDSSDKPLEDVIINSVEIVAYSAS